MSNKLSLYVVALVICSMLSVSEAAAEERTRLRASKPTGTFETRRGATTLTKVMVEVRNAGEVAAKDITVQIELPNGTMEKASGPNTLEPKAEASYVAYPYDYVVTNNKLKADVRCANCYR